MPILKAKTRNKLPKSEFGLPGSKKYPMQDKAHAANAKARASQMVKKGKLSEASKEKIDAKANRVLGKSRAEKRPEKKSRITEVKAHRTLAGYRK